MLGNNLSDVEVVEGLEARILRGSFPRNDFEVLQGVSDSFGDRPLAVRSSGPGDARGTGTYETVFTDNKVGELRKGIQRVLISYFSESALAFRHDAQAGDGFGRIIEPIIGQALEYPPNGIAPVLSGYGYTSTLRGEGFVNMVPGLGGGVDTRYGERITESAMREFNSLTSYVYHSNERDSTSFPGSRESSLLMSVREHEMYFNWYGQIYSSASAMNKGRIISTILDFKNDAQVMIELTKFGRLYSMMNMIERAFGKPQYFEWAATINGMEAQYWILQIADVEKKIERLDFGDYEDVVMMAHTVTSSGEIECEKIAVCTLYGHIPALHEFNQHNSGYLLLYSSDVVDRYARRAGFKISYSDFSNAAAFIEQQQGPHGGKPIDHLGTQLELTGKLFGVLDYYGDVEPQLDRLEEREVEEHGLRVFQGRYFIQASEAQNLMLVSMTD